MENADSKASTPRPLSLPGLPLAPLAVSYRETPSLLSHGEKWQTEGYSRGRVGGGVCIFCLRKITRTMSFSSNTP
jgi:hypothetical protein